MSTLTDHGPATQTCDGCDQRVPEGTLCFDEESGLAICDECSAKAPEVPRCSECSCDLDDTGVCENCTGAPTGGWIYSGTVAHEMLRSIATDGEECAEADAARARAKLSAKSLSWASGSELLDALNTVERISGRLAFFTVLARSLRSGVEAHGAVGNLTDILPEDHSESFGVGVRAAAEEVGRWMAL